MNLLVVLNWCYGIAKPFSPLFCPDVHLVGNQIKRVAHLFDRTFVMNDYHSGGWTDEFKYLPPHNVDEVSRTLLDHELYKVARKVETIRKHELNAFGNDHAASLLFLPSPKNIMVTGFTASTDVIPTCLALIDLGQNVYVHKDCIGDISPDRKAKSLEYIEFIGIPILDGEINAESFSFFERQTTATKKLS